MKNRQEEVEELKSRNQALNVVVKTNDASQDEVCLEGKLLGNDQSKYCVEGE